MYYWINQKIQEPTPIPEGDLIKAINNLADNKTPSQLEAWAFVIAKDMAGLTEEDQRHCRRKMESLIDSYLDK